MLATGSMEGVPRPSSIEHGRFYDLGTSDLDIASY